MADLTPAEAVAHWTAEADYWTAEVPAAEAYSAGARATARHARDNALAQLAAAHDRAKAADSFQVTVHAVDYSDALPHLDAIRNANASL